MGNKMIKKLILLRNIIKDSAEKRLLENLIKEAATSGSFSSEIPDIKVHTVLVNSLTAMIKTVLPAILEEFYPNEEKEIINNFVNNNALDILYTEIGQQGGGGNDQTILDLYMKISVDIVPSDEDHATINVDEPYSGSNSGPLSLMPEEPEFDSIPEYSEEDSLDILEMLLHHYVETKNPLGKIEDEDEDEFDHFYDEDEDEDEEDRFLRMMNEKRNR